MENASCVREDVTAWLFVAVQSAAEAARMWELLNRHIADTNFNVFLLVIFFFARLAASQINLHALFFLVELS